MWSTDATCHCPAHHMPVRCPPRAMRCPPHASALPPHASALPTTCQCAAHQMPVWCPHMPMRCPPHAVCCPPHAVCCPPHAVCCPPHSIALPTTCRCLAYPSQSHAMLPLAPAAGRSYSRAPPVGGGGRPGPPTVRGCTPNGTWVQSAGIQMFSQ